MDQQGFTLRQPAAVEHVRPDGEEGFRNRGGFDEAEALGHRQHLGRRRQAVFGIAAAGGQGADLIADAEPRDIRADRGDLARHFQAGQVGGAGRRRTGSGALKDIGTVDTGSLDAISTSPGPGWGTGRVVG